MAAYAALISLSNTIEYVLNHNRLSISLEENQQLRSLLEFVTSFQAFLDKFPDKSGILEGRMRELAHEAEDIIECFMLDQVSSWPGYQTKEIIFKLKQIIDNIDLLKEYDGSGSEEDELGADSSAALSSSSIAPPIRKDAMVGFEDLAMELKERLCGETSKLQVIPICGMAGTGKTTLARNVYDDPSIINHFVIRIWVTISQYYSVQRNLSSILECLKEFNTGGLGLGQSDDEEKVYQILRGKRYLVVMDSIWSTKAWDAVRRVFPNDGNGSRVMLTTRLHDVASYPDPSSKLHEMGLLSEDQSWELLKQKAFGDEDCLSELENIAKDIARRCKGWPLAIMAFARALSAIKGSAKLWQKFADDNSIIEELISSSLDDSGCHPSGKHELQLKKVIQEIDLVAKQVKEIMDSSKSKEVQHGGQAALSSSPTVLSIHRNSMVGFEEHMMDLKGRLCGETSKLQVIPICGMGGIGKTTLARNIYDDPLIMGYFVIRVWVTISQDYSAYRILSSILESLNEYNIEGLGQSDDEKVYKILVGRRYLIVMDDIWNSEAWDVVRRVFPDDCNGSRVMLTTRLSRVASYPNPSSKLHEMGLLNADHSWNLLKQKVFADEDCPCELQTIGKEIAGSCKGLPLAIVVIAGLLSTVTKNPTSWLEIAEHVKSAGTAEHNQIEEILYLSYVQLPQYLRPCFLYMGSYPEDHEIQVKELTRLWVAEGFVKCPIDSDNFEKVAEECLEELVKRNLVLVRKRKWDGRIKSCILHDLMRDLCIRNDSMQDFCIRQSHESKFFLNMMDRHIGKESFIENVRNQRRVSVDSSNLGYLSSLHGSTIRSIKYWRNHTARSLDFLESVRLLRVLDAESLGVSLPTPVHPHELFHLRYLAIASYTSIPRSLSMLQNLQTLIIHEENRDACIWLRWCMSQLRHVCFRGRILFHYPEESTCPLENLQTLSYVSYESCTERIMKLIPNLKRLKIDCSGHHDEDPVWLNNLVHLHRLENLHIHRCDLRGPTFTFPWSLKKLTLKDLCLSPNDIFVVGSLPNLQMLKLTPCVCLGGTWETTEGAFPALEHLQVTLLHWENWITESSHFPKLKSLLMDYCRDLNEIPNDIGNIPTLEMIKLTGQATKSLVESVEQIREEQEDYGNTLHVLCSVEIRGRSVFQSFGRGDDDDNDDDDD